MTGQAIDARLRETSRLAGSLRPEDRLTTKIDLSGGAVARRLKDASDLLRLCRTLARGRVPIVSDIDLRDDEAILRRFGLEPDPVVEAYKKDVDRTLLRENLRRSPEERCRNFLAAYRLAEELRRSGAAVRGR